MKKSLLLSLSLVLSGGLFAQVTLDDFNDGTDLGWAPANDGANVYTHTEAGGELKIEFDVTQPSWYPRSTFTFPNPVDMSTNHVIRVALRTQNLSGSTSVRVDLIDNNTYTSNGTPFDLVPINSDGNVHIYEWSMTGNWYASFWAGFSGFWQMDSTNVTGLEFFINANGAVGQDSLWIDYIEIDSVFQGTGPTDGDITFEVDMNSYDGPAFTGAFVNGTFNNWCGSCWPLDDSDGDGVWTGTFPDQALINYEFLFTVDGFADQEMLIGATAFNCGNPNNNRVFTLLSDTTLAFCWESCTDCASEPCIGEVPDPRIITDAECQFNALYNDWEAGWWWVPNPQVDADNPSDGVYSYTKYFQDGIVRAVSTEGPVTIGNSDVFRMDILQNYGPNMLVLVQPLGLDTLDFANVFDTLTTPGQWQEVTFDLSAHAGSQITGIHFFIGVGDAGSTQEQLWVDNMRLEDITIGINELDVQELNLYPNPTAGVLNIPTVNNALVSIHDASGRLLRSENSNGSMHTMDISELAKGWYLVQVSENGIIKRSKVVLE